MNTEDQLDTNKPEKEHWPEDPEDRTQILQHKFLNHHLKLKWKYTTTPNWIPDPSPGKNTCWKAS